MKLTRLTQQPSNVYCLAEWARIFRGKTEVTSEKHYSTLDVTWVVINVFRMSHSSLYSVRSSCIPHITARFIEDIFSILFIFIPPLGFRGLFYGEFTQNIYNVIYVHIRNIC
jgi:hypothetical protein